MFMLIMIHDDSPLKVVTLAVYVYFAVSLIGEQWTESEKVKPKKFSLFLNIFSSLTSTTPSS